MAGPTDARVATPCPMCGEPLDGAPERCFRCETPLADWWRFEDTLARLPAATAGAPSRAAPRVRGAIAGGLFAAVALVALWIVRAPAPGSGLAAAPQRTLGPAPAATTAAPAVIRYHVQRGDSLSRIAARLTGDGRRWRELWPERVAGGGRLAAGTVLEVRLPAR